jgi:DNA-binding response OmpR family regulator
LIRDLVVEVLEDEGYTVTAVVTPMEATRLLDQVGLDLVITDGFSTLPESTFANTADVLRSAGPTPVALFSAHTHDLDVAKAAGFSDLIAKPFNLDMLVHQVKVLLDHPADRQHHNVRGMSLSPPEDGTLFVPAVTRRSSAMT